MQRFTLTANDCYCSLLDFYKNVAREMGVKATRDTYFDCRHISVTRNIQKQIYRYYQEINKTPVYEISKAWLMYGPKSNIPSDGDKYLVEVEDGFILK